MENIQLTENEEIELIKIFSFLNTSHNARKTEPINHAEEELRLMDKDKLSFIKLLIKGLSITKIRNEEISLDLHKSLLIYLKNYLLINQKCINNCDIYDYFCRIINLMLTPTENKNIRSESMLILFHNLIKTIFDNNNSMMEEVHYVEKLLLFILDKISSVQDNNFLFVAANGLGLISCFLSSKSVGQKNYLELIQKYLIPTSDIIFSKVYLYIIPNNNIYNIEFIIILKNLYETFYDSLNKMKRFYPSLKRKEFAEEFFKKYGTYTYELIQIIPICDVETKLKFGDENPILVFDDNYQEINLMKANAFKFMSLIIQYVTMSSSSNNNSANENNIDEKKLIISNHNIVDIISKLITLSIKSFENILNCGKKFNFLRQIEDERADEDNIYNILLFEIESFLIESLTKEPIKSEFDQHIKLFLLNILFPLLITVESEKSYMEREPDEYCAYFKDLVYNFTLKNFRIHGIFLIKKISEDYIDISNFILSYIIGMFKYIMNKGDINQNNNINNLENDLNNQYNAYFF